MVVQEMKKQDSLRTVIAFPDIHTFYDLLQDQLNMGLLRYGFLNEPFTIFINALPREVTQEMDRFESVVLNYAGVPRQRELLEGPPEKQNKALDGYWHTLDRANLRSDSAVVSSALYQQFRDGKHSLDSIISSAGTLTDYFKLDLPEEERSNSYNIWQVCEFQILKASFNLREYRYLSVPLIQFGEFDGVAHLVYSEKDYWQRGDDPQGTDRLRKFVVGNIIKLFSVAYEALIMEWELVGTNADKETAVRAALDAAIDPVFFESFNTNPILKELGFQNFYKKFEKYYQKRFEQTDVIPRERRRQHHKIAIMSILIDSYAHNVTAHSLTALEWWFRLRAERLRRAGDETYEQFVEDYSANPVVSKESLAIELYPLMKFLLDKGAFWTGLTRERSFGGKISSLFSVLWFDFINNPLYLGTIAFSEGILKLNIRIMILDQVEHIEKVGFRKRIRKDENGVLLAGNFVTIDLTKLSTNGQTLRPERISDFVIPGEKFSAFEKVLKSFKTFFPGGVVGRHAFFTILENEIRNVKHFGKKDIEQMQEDGLTLSISLEEDTYRKGDQVNGRKDYFKVGVWINHPVRLDRELVSKRVNRLGEDIIDEETFKPRLGGTFQDKVCAAMLFNNTFTSVQDKEGKRNMRYYPWMKAGGNFLPDNNEEEIFDYEITWRRFTAEDYAASRNYLDTQMKAGPGYFKKFFSIWKGENIYNVDETDRFANIYENYSRFRFVSIAPEKRELYRTVRQEGVFRIIGEPAENLLAAYRLWLRKWLKGQGGYRVVFKINRQPAAHIYWNGEDVEYRSRTALRNLSPEVRSTLLDPDQTVVQNIQLVHGNKDSTPDEGFCRYRSHGILKRYFLQGKSIHQADLSPELAAELLEILATKVGVFDNRVAQRVEKRVNKENLENALNCHIFKEDVDLWRAEREKGFSSYHFLVVHLSFIEAFRDAEGRKLYTEDKIDQFILQEITQGQQIAEDFILVITTGRGRTQWWSSLERGKAGQYTHFTTFRPVESLIDSVENAINMEDDFELKYRLVKVLFGS